MFYNFTSEKFDKHGVVNIFDGTSGIVKELHDVGVIRLQAYEMIDAFKVPYVLNEKHLKYLNRKYRNKTIELYYGKVIIKKRSK